MTQARSSAGVRRSTATAPRPGTVSLLPLAVVLASDLALLLAENGYLIGMTPCSFLTPPVFPKNKKVRTVARYNNTEPHTGVMGLMLSTMYEVPA